MAIYPEVVRNLLNASEKYKKQVMNLDDYKSKVWQAASSIVAVEEKELRRFLQEAEAELDSLQFTVDDDKLFQATMAVVERIEERLSNL